MPNQSPNQPRILTNATWGSILSAAAIVLTIIGAAISADRRLTSVEVKLTNVETATARVEKTLESIAPPTVRRAETPSPHPIIAWMVP